MERLAAILASIPDNQKCTRVKKWHKVLGKLRSMALAMPGAKHLFSQMQLAIVKIFKYWVTLSKEVHNALTNFC